MRLIEPSRSGDLILTRGDGGDRIGAGKRGRLRRAGKLPAAGALLLRLRLLGLFGDLGLLAGEFGLLGGLRREIEKMIGADHQHREDDRQDEVLVVARHECSVSRPAAGSPMKTFEGRVKIAFERAEIARDGRLAARSAHNHARRAPGPARPALAAARKRRLMRLRVTALPSFLVTVKPMRAAS